MFSSQGSAICCMDQQYPTGRAEWAGIKAQGLKWPLEWGVRYIDLTEITSTYLYFFLAALVASCSARRVLSVSAS